MVRWSVNVAGEQVVVPRNGETRDETMAQAIEAGPEELLEAFGKYFPRDAEVKNFAARWANEEGYSACWEATFTSVDNLFKGTVEEYQEMLNEKILPLMKYVFADANLTKLEVVASDDSTTASEQS